MKGFWYMAESVIAAVILISFLVIIGNKATAPAYYADDMTVKGFSILYEASQRQSFRDKVYSSDISGILNEIGITGYYYNISICSYDGSCEGYNPRNINRTVWTSMYIFSGNGSFSPKILRLYIWR